MRTLLITGFDPFGGQRINPSWEAVKLLPEEIGNFRLHKLMIPTVFGEAAESVLSVAKELRPDVILSVGQAGGRDAITPERIGINLRSASLPDNAGNQPAQEPVIEGGPDGIFSTLPVEEMVKAIRAAGDPASVSNTAGTFVCNDVLYTLLHHYAGTSTRVGFVHLPYLPEQGEPNLPLEAMVKALTAAIGVL